jgi:hypothetical protein
MIGLKASADARSMVAAADAVQDMVDDAGHTGAIRMEAMLAAHRTLMKDDPLDGQHAGKFRDVQNWIGGSDYSPRGAIHVPPPPELVPELMEDLFVFCNRTDVPIMAQAAIAHAQFESIHPFTDGNGRIGRALIGAFSRRRKLTRNTGVLDPTFRDRALQIPGALDVKSPPDQEGILAELRAYIDEHGHRPRQGGLVTEQEVRLQVWVTNNTKGTAESKNPVLRAPPRSTQRYRRDLPDMG